ncbi:cytochrome b/b6 domain-containing protein [Aquibium sp. A9E412]|uniref:cytochrome b n=1 Tax=Aquibium sp. A9E412 TaxID=2976767 RepID=UPI0025B1F1F0|nr:cytochrome b/b6 domain-containing protein [Aquibium sp. A9E412]MDN2565971.1 cytochrome b/b6 domain-containing protein [Aquibium sp. A9E412]
MTLRSSPTAYGRVAVALHWSTALLVLVALGSGFAADSLAADAAPALRAHVAAGGMAGLLTLLRVVWWWAADTRPAAAGTGSTARMARVAHALLIVVPLGMAASGVGLMLLSGAGAQLFLGAAGPLPDFDALQPRAAHGLGAIVLLGLLALHVAAALYHQLVLRDRLLARMGFGRRA